VAAMPTAIPRTVNDVRSECRRSDANATRNRIGKDIIPLLNEGTGERAEAALDCRHSWNTTPARRIGHLPR
jgi:hypothetical protein